MRLVLLIVNYLILFWIQIHFRSKLWKCSISIFLLNNFLWGRQNELIIQNKVNLRMKINCCLCTCTCTCTCKLTMLTCFKIYDFFFKFLWHLGDKMAAKDAEEMIEEADQNGDGKIDYKGTWRPPIYGRSLHCVTLSVKHAMGRRGKIEFIAKRFNFALRHCLSL